MPESVFDTTENKYIRLFIYKYFNIKSIVSLPQLTFAPFTSTKTSLLFAQKKNKTEVENWNTLWTKCSKKWGFLKTRCEALIIVYLDEKYLFSWDDVTGNDTDSFLEYLKKKFNIDWTKKAKIEKIDDIGTINVSTEKNSLSLILNNEKTKVNLKIDDGRTFELMVRTENCKLNIYDKIDRQNFPSIKDLNEEQEKEVLTKMLKDYIEEDDKELSSKALIKKYINELKELCKDDTDTKDAFGQVNTWWVFSEVAKKLNYKIFMAEVENIGYKRTKRSEKSMPNELFRTDEKGNILVDDGKIETALDYLRKIKWE